MSAIQPPASSTPIELLADYCYGIISRQIREGILAPGARINIEKLARELDVSPTPLRESLPRLEADGFVIKNANRGYSVSPLLNSTGYRNAFHMRLLLEPEAARLAADHCTTDGLAALQSAITVFVEAQRMVDANEPVNHIALAHADAVFHDTIGANCGNELLAHTIRRMRAHLHLHSYPFDGPEIALVVTEHTAIATAISTGNGAAAHAAMAAHIESARERMHDFYPA